MQIHLDKYERTWLIAVTIVMALFFASLVAGVAVFGVRPTGTAGILNPNYINEGPFAAQNLGVFHRGGNQYEAYILAQKWAFTPASITVPVGAQVTFNVASRDITHGFMIDRSTVNLQLVPGHISRTSFTFDKAGEFAIQCHEYCGRGHHLMHATIIVENPTTALNEE